MYFSRTISVSLLAIILTGCKLNFDSGPNGTIVESSLGYECSGECTDEPASQFSATYLAVPKLNYQFAGWSGNACNSDARRLNPECPVLVVPPIAALNMPWNLEAEFTRKANMSAIQNTPEFEITNYGFGGFYTEEVPPLTCYPDIDSCDFGEGASWIEPSTYATGDFNNDGYQDLVVQPYMNNHYITKQQKPGPVIFLNDGAGSLYRSDDIFANGKSEDMLFGYRIAVADFNGDGVDDLVVGPFGILSREPDTYGDYFPERISLYLSGEDGKLHDASDLIQGQEGGTVIPGMTFAHDLSIGDIDGDGDLDLYLARQMLINNGDGSFMSGVSLANEDGYRSYVMSTLIGDFDGDGIGDLVIYYGEGPEGSLSKLYLSDNNPDLLSRQPVLFPEGLFGAMNTKHNHAATADLDGDGDLDIVVGQTRVNPYYVGRALQLFINDGRGSFTDETATRLGDQRYYTNGKTANQGEGFVRLLDFNGDGHLDIYDRRGAPNKQSDDDPYVYGAAIWLNDGAGNFVDVPGAVFPHIEPRHLAPRNGDSNLFSNMTTSAPIDLDGKAGLDLVSYVVTNAYPFWNFGESTLYTLTSKKVLRASDYAD